MNICVICFEPIKSCTIYKLECSHQFHNKCILKWKKINNTCPICRKKIIIKKNNLNIVFGNILVMLYIFAIVFFLTTFILKFNHKIVELNK